MPSRWKRKAISGGQALRDIVLNFLAPITESREFKALYPVLVVSLGVLAVFQANRLRTMVVAVAFGLIAIASLFVIYQDAQKIRLECRWNLLFFSYYRPFLIELTKKIARPLDRKERIDTLTYRTDDFILALDEATADFAQVSGDRIVNIASFDIEYVPVLKTGFTRDGSNVKLVPLSDFWEGREIYDLKDLVVSEIRQQVLQFVDGERISALPVGWGLVGVSIIEQDRLPNRDALAALSRTSQEIDGFDFKQFFAKIDSIRTMGYEVLLYDFWSSIAQLVLLNYTGHMTISTAEEQQIADAFKELRRAIPPKDVIADPVVLLDRVRASEKSVVIGGSTWFGITGNLLPIAVPDAEPAYGAFCECLGILAPPRIDDNAHWEHDAYALMSWFVSQLRGDGLAAVVPKGRRAIIQNYISALLPAGHRNGPGTSAGSLSNLPMRTDTRASFKFRRFADTDPGAIARMKALWENTRTP
jgi:hypothetical protein